jgi:hypothetical protein
MSQTYDSTSNYEALTVENLAVGVLTTPSIVTGTLAATSVSTGSIVTGLGTAAAPSIAFSTDINTGIFSSGTDVVSISSGGADVADFTSSGLDLHTPLDVGLNPITGVVQNVSPASATPRSYVDSTGCLFWYVNALPTFTTINTYVPMIGLGSTYFSDANWTVVSSPPSITYVGALARIYTVSLSASGTAASGMSGIIGVFQNGGLINPTASSTTYGTTPSSCSASAPLLVSPGDVFVPRIAMTAGAGPVVLSFMTMTFN